MYAIQASDLLVILQKEAVLRALLKPLIADQHTVDVAPKLFDGCAVALNCDDERAAAVVGVIRLRYRRDQVRCYRSETGKGSWRRV